MDEITVVVRRKIKPGAEAAFERAMQEFVRFALGFPGNKGIQVLRPVKRDGREYTVVNRFADAQARQNFKATSDYRQWMQRLGEMTENEPSIEELSGLGGWFTPPDEPRRAMPSRLKMAFVTFLGVLPLTSALPRVVARLLPGIHPLVGNVLVTALIVTLLTWIVMPLLTRIFSPWLFRQP